MRSPVSDLVLVVGTVSVCLLFAGSCVEQESPLSTSNLPPVHEPWPDARAEMLALTVSCDVCAPKDLYDVIHADLLRIDAEWCDSIPLFCSEPNASNHPWCDSMPLYCCNIHPRLPHALQELTLQVTDKTHAAIQSGTYDAWNGLNDHYGLERFDFVQLGASPVRYRLYFLPLLDMSIVADWYNVLPGVVDAYPEELSTEGTCLSVAYSPDVRIYTFRLAWGDCMAGCYARHFWEIETDGESSVLLRDWGDPVPHGLPR